jgi:hypothetical protein
MVVQATDISDETKARISQRLAEADKVNSNQTSALNLKEIKFFSVFKYIVSFKKYIKQVLNAWC